MVSVLGALIAHLLLLVVIVLLLTLGGVVGPSESEAASEPQEVTIMISDLIPEPPQEEPGKQYVRTDPDQQADRPPESARFESDRDTLAATQMLPDPNAEAVKDMPTIAGRDDLPSLELRDREFAEGDPIELPPPASAASQPTPPSSVLPPDSSANPAVAASAATMAAKSESQQTAQSQAQAAGNTDADGDRDADTQTDGKSESKALDEGDADKTRRPDALLLAENTEAETKESFADPLAADDAPQIGRDEGAMDRQAAADRKAEEVGSPVDAAAAASGSSAAAQAPAVGGAMAAQPAAPASTPSPGEAAVKPAFQPLTRANEVSGTLSNLGKKAALDVEATELGRYKKSVVSAIEQEWHRYRLSNMDDITAGNLRLRFRVDSGGRVRNLKIVRNEANIGMTEFTLKAILAAKIPAMPEDVAAMLGSGGLIMNYNILVVY